MQKYILRVSIAITFCATTIGHADILWCGDYETGNFMQWHTNTDSNRVSFWQIPHYGAPRLPSNLTAEQSYTVTGDGSLASIVTNPKRNGTYAAKFTVKNATNGNEPDDCDNGRSSCRRSELSAQRTLPDYYNAMPYLSERWMSISHYVPEDWEEKRSGWGPVVFQVKPAVESGLSPCFSIAIEGTSWRLGHIATDVANPKKSDTPWQKQMFYTNDATSQDGLPYPRSDFWPQGLEDYPNPNASQVALGNLNRGGWTDWVINIKYDSRGKKSGGTGFLDVWKRANHEPWVHVLHVVPKMINRGGLSFDRGICYNSPSGPDTNGGFGIKVGLYMEKSQVWSNTRNRVIYNDNIKVGGRETSFNEMTPDGSSLEAKNANLIPSTQK